MLSSLRALRPILRQRNGFRGAAVITIQSEPFSSGRPRRDPPMPPLTNPMLRSIEDAQQRGELNHLSGSGKPLPKRTDTTIPVGMSGTQVMAQKAEFEMRRAIHNQELNDLAGQGEALPYKGTSVTGAELSQQQGGGGGLDVVSDFVLKESKLSSEELKQL